MKRQYIKQFILWAIEFTIVVGVCVYISNLIKPPENVYEIIMRILILMVIYQGIVVIFNKNMLDVKSDAFLAEINALEYAQLYYETGNEPIKIELLKGKDKCERTKVFWTEETWQDINTLYEFLNSPDKKEEAMLWIKIKLISVKHSMELERLTWNKTFIVRLMK